MIKGGIIMENASQAIKMAGSVLLFVIAISVIILSFNQARITADTIFRILSAFNLENFLTSSSEIE